MSRKNNNLVLGLAFGAGTFVGVVSTYLWIGGCRKRQQPNYKNVDDEELSDGKFSENDNLPSFVEKLEQNPDLHHIRLREWEDLEWRQSNGWKGRDLCHNPYGKAVRVLDYYYNDITKEMIGVVWFGPEAESHRGLCHGGAMSSLMDDFCGHMAFIDSDKPWSGATVQVNVSLKKPVQVGQILRIAGKVTEKKGRKVHVEATLDNGGGVDDDGDNNNNNKNVVYATLEGLSIDGVKMSDHDDEVAERIWEVNKCKTTGRLQRRDSGWNAE